MFNTYLWHEVRGDNWWRIQTNDPRVIRKLRRRKTASLCLWCINDSIVVFRTQYYSAKEAKKSLHRLTGQKPKKDAENGLFFAETGVILTSKLRLETSNIEKDE